MAYSNDDLLKLEKAIARGVLTVQYADRRGTYYDLDAMRRLRAEMKGELETAAGKKPRKRFVRVFQSGRGN